MAHRYKRIEQKKALCGPTCFQMILQRRGLPVLDQEQIALETDTRVEERNKHLYSVDLPTTTNKREAGLWLHEYERINRLIEKYNLPIRVERIVYISQIPDVKKFIEENISQDNDLIANVWMKLYFRDQSFGHYLLVDSLDNETLTFCDPNSQNPAHWTASLEKLVKTMGKKWDGKERGFIVVKSS